MEPIRHVLLFADIYLFYLGRLVTPFRVWYVSAEGASPFFHAV